MQHYSQVSWAAPNVETQKERDQRKLEICKEKGITLLYIPYFMDLSSAALTHLILKSRPDVAKHLLTKST